MAKKANATNVVPFPAPLDDVFFTKEQMKIGCKLRYFGRTNPNKIYTVTDIVSWERYGTGDYWQHTVHEACRLDDQITVKCGNDVRTMSFAYLSYSAIWRVER